MFGNLRVGTFGTRSLLWRCVAAVTLAIMPADVIAALLPDAAFGVSGEAVLAAPPAFDGADPMLAAHADGRIVLAATPAYGAASVLIGRLLPTGLRDSTFGLDGRVLLPISDPALSRLRLHQVQPQPDGGLLIVAEAFAAGQPQTAALVLKVRADGSPDPQFNAGAPLRRLLPPGREPRLLPQRDGLLLFARALTKTFGGTGPSGMDMTRFKADGSIDTAFGRDGSISEPAGAGTVSDALVLPDGSFQTVNGEPVGNGFTRSRWRRYTADGRPDLAFGTAGWMDIFPPSYDAFARLLPLGDGRYLGISARGTALAYFDAEARELGAFTFFQAFEYAHAFGGGRVFAAAETQPLLLPTPFDGVYFVALDGDGRPDPQFGDSGSYRPQGQSLRRKGSVVMDSPSSIVLARTLYAGGFALTRLRETRGAPAQPVPGPGGPVLVLLAAALAVAAAGRVRQHGCSGSLDHGASPRPWSAVRRAPLSPSGL